MRKSQRKRQTSRKFNDQDYALNIDDLHSTSSTTLISSSPTQTPSKSSSNSKAGSSSSGGKKPPLEAPKTEPSSFNVSLEAEQKGELKLRIKRIVSTHPHGVGPSTILTSLVNSPDTTTPSKIEFSTDRTSLDSCGDDDKRSSRRKRNSSDLPPGSSESGSLYKSIFLYPTTSSGDTPDADADNLNTLMMISSPLSANNHVSESIAAAKSTRLKSNNTPKSFNFSPTSTSSIFSDVAGLNSSPILSPTSTSSATTTIPMTRSAAAKLKQQLTSVNQSSLIDAKLLPPPPPLPVPPQNLFNDEENDDEMITTPVLLIDSKSSEKTSNQTPVKSETTTTTTTATSNVKTLAQIKAQLAERKKRTASNDTTTEEPKRPKLDSDSYTTNIQKIVHELKSIGNGSTDLIDEDDEETSSSISSSSKPSKIVVDDFLNLTPTLENNSTVSKTDNNSNHVTIDLTSLLKQQQKQLREVEKKRDEAFVTAMLIDTSLLTDEAAVAAAIDSFDFLVDEDNPKTQLIELPNIGTFFKTRGVAKQHQHPQIQPPNSINMNMMKRPLPPMNSQTSPYNHGNMMQMNQMGHNMMPQQPMRSPHMTSPMKPIPPQSPQQQQQSPTSFPVPQPPRNHMSNGPSMNSSPFKTPPPQPQFQSYPPPPPPPPQSQYNSYNPSYGKYASPQQQYPPPQSMQHQQQTVMYPGGYNNQQYPTQSSQQYPQNSPQQQVVHHNSPFTQPYPNMATSNSSMMSQYPPQPQQYHPQSPYAQKPSQVAPNPPPPSQQQYIQQQSSSSPLQQQQQQHMGLGHMQPPLPPPMHPSQMQTAGYSPQHQQPPQQIVVVNQPTQPPQQPQQIPPIPQQQPPSVNSNMNPNMAANMVNNNQGKRLRVCVC